MQLLVNVVMLTSTKTPLQAMHCVQANLNMLEASKDMDEESMHVCVPLGRHLMHDRNLTPGPRSLIQTKLDLPNTIES